MSSSRRLVVPLALAVVLGALYVWWPPHSVDLAAQVARSDLFRRSGFVPYWAGWYAGVTTTSYSLVTPFLLGLFGAIWLGALSVVATGCVVVPLLRDTRRPTIGASAFVIAGYLDVVSGRTTFAVGAVVALGAVVAVERRRVVLGAVLGCLATVTSPVAGVLLLVVVAALLIADSQRRLAAVALGAGVAVTTAAIAVLARGDTGGYQPFSAPSLAFALATAAFVALSPVGRRVRWGAVVTMAALLAAFSVNSAVGSNVLRLTTLAAVPTLLAVAELAAVPVAVVSLLAAYPPIAQLHYDIARAAAHDYQRSFTAPVLQQLVASSLLRDHRVEVVDTATHWPSTYLVPRVMLARGWERQTDEHLNPEFYGRAPLTATTYRGFLDRNAVAFVAVARGVPLDYGAHDEAALIRSGLPYLKQVWSDAHWQLYAVSSPTPIVTAPAVVIGHSDTGVTLRAPSPGRYLLRMRWSPYLVVTGGTILRGRGGDTTVALTTGGTHRVHATWRFP